jgi:hypothetical protein
MRFAKLALATSISMAVLSGAAVAGDIEMAYLVRPLNDNSGIIVRADGTAWVVTKGVGCPGFETTQGTRVLVESEGAFLRPYDSTLIFPDGQRCKVHASRPMGPLEEAPDVDDVIDQELTEDERYTLAQAALKSLGYYQGVVSGVDDSFDDALLGFKENAGLDPNPELDPATMILISRDLQVLYPDDAGHLSIALTMREDAARILIDRPGCRRISVTDVYTDRRAIGLADGSVAVLESESRILEESEPGDDMIICGVTLVSMASGEVARVRVVTK